MKVLVAWHVNMLGDDVNMNPSRFSSGRNAPFLSQMNPPRSQIPIVCSWLTILFCHPLSDIIALCNLQSQIYSVRESVIPCKIKLFCAVLSFET